MDDRMILAIRRPEPKLMRLYIIRAILSGPGIVIAWPLYHFRYHSMRYRFDDEGVHMKWGVLFRKEVNLTYARIQDIHLTSGPIQRWLGMADVQVQTASGNAGAEMTIEGLSCYSAIRDFLYSRMRGYREQDAPKGESARAIKGEDEAVALLRNIHDDLRASRVSLARLSGKEGSRDV